MEAEPFGLIRVFHLHGPWLYGHIQGWPLYQATRISREGRERPLALTGHVGWGGPSPERLLAGPKGAADLGLYPSPVAHCWGRGFPSRSLPSLRLILSRRASQAQLQGPGEAASFSLLWQLFFFLRFYLFIEREKGGRKRRRETWMWERYID